MRILLLQLDGKLPSVALMRISAHHRALGDEVELRNARSVASVQGGLWDQHDRVYASLIFEASRPIAERLLVDRPDAIVGGTGWDFENGVPRVLRPTTLESKGITTIVQDYSVYPRSGLSIGYSQRGCRFNCDFCGVPFMEGGVRKEQAAVAIWRGAPFPRHLVLLDNDFFGQLDWRAQIDAIRSGGFSVSFCQGINARVLSTGAADAIASVDYRDVSGRERRIYTAWDNRGDEDPLLRGLRRLIERGVKPQAIMVYILVGHWPGETHEERDYRRVKLREIGVRPYPMPKKRTSELVAFQRWVIGGYDKRISWDEWMRSRGQPRLAAERHHRRTYQLPIFAEE